MVQSAILTLMIAAYLKDTMTWRKSGGRDQWGTSAARTDVATAARVNWHNKMIRDMEGREVVSSGSIYVKERPAIDDLFTIEGRDHPILNIHEKKAFSAVYYEVFIA